MHAQGARVGRGGRAFSAKSQTGKWHSTFNLHLLFSLYWHTITTFLAQTDLATSEKDGHSGIAICRECMLYTSDWDGSHPMVRSAITEVREAPNGWAYQTQEQGSRREMEKDPEGATMQVPGRGTGFLTLTTSPTLSRWLTPIVFSNPPPPPPPLNIADMLCS